MASTYGTSITTYSSAIETIWKKEILDIAEGYLVIDRWAVSEGIPMKGGNTMRVNRILRPAKKTTAKTPGTLVQADSSTIKKLTANYKDFTIEIFEDSFQFDEDVNIVSFISDKKNQHVIANQFARSHENLLIKKLHDGGMWWRIDGKATNYMALGTVTTAHTGTLFTDTGLTEAAGIWDNAQVCFYHPQYDGYDEAATVTNWDESNDQITLSLDNSPGVGAMFIITNKTDIAASDKMTTVGLLNVSGLHEGLETPKFNGNTIRAIMNASQHRDLHDDAEWKTYVQYDRSKIVENYTPARWFDIETLIGSEVIRTDVSNSESSSGAAHACPIFGKDSYVVFRYGHGSGLFNVEWLVVDGPDSYNVTASVNLISWKSKWTGGVLRATSMINLITGGTGTGLNSII